MMPCIIVQILDHLYDIWGRCPAANEQAMDYYREMESEIVFYISLVGYRDL